MGQIGTDKRYEAHCGTKRDRWKRLNIASGPLYDVLRPPTVHNDGTMPPLRRCLDGRTRPPPQFQVSSHFLQQKNIPKWEISLNIVKARFSFHIPR